MLPTLAAIVTSIVLPASSLAYAEPPVIFTAASVDDAITAATRDQKLAIVHATATWCGPCKMMKKTTYADQGIIDWFKASAVAAQFDVDKEPQTAVRFKIRAMPTVIVLKGGEEVARKVGYQSAADMTEWLENVKAGKVAADAPPVNVDGMSMQERIQNARELAENGKNAEALTEYLWLWENIVLREPAMSGVRGSFLASDIGNLVSQYAPAKDAFLQVRDRAEAFLKSEDRTFEILDDWLVLNQIASDNDRSLAWFDRHKEDADFQRTWDYVGFRFDRLLREKGRKADLAKVLDLPERRLEGYHDLTSAIKSDRMDASGKKQVELMCQRQFAEDYALYLLGDRENEAKRFLTGAIALMDTPELRMACVEAALEESEPRPEHVELLKQAAAAGADTAELSEWLVAALAAGAK
jgi:thiol-disulfide isomerase/thioredoxin